MIILLGYDGATEQYKLFNTEVDTKDAIRYCPYSQKDMLFGTSDSRTKEQESLNRQFMGLSPQEGIMHERKILYFSCNYNRESRIVSEIEAHLVTGDIISLTKLNKFDYTCERRQIMDMLGMVDNDDNLEITSFYISRTSELITTKDSSVQIKTGRTSIVPLYAENLGVILSVVLFSQDTVNVALSLPSIIHNGNKVRSLYTPNRLLPDGNFRVSVTTYRKDVLEGVVNDRYFAKLNTAVLQAKVAFAETIEDAQSCVVTTKNRQAGMKPIEYSGLIQLEYLYSIKPEIRYQVELSNGVLDLGAQIESATQFSGYTNATQFYSDNEVLLVDNGVLKAVLSADKDSITVDLNGITAIGDYALSGFSNVNFVCTGELRLKSYGVQYNVDYHSVDRVIEECINKLEVERREQRRKEQLNAHTWDMLT